MVFEGNKVTVGVINIGVIKGAHGSAPVKVNIRSAVDSVDISIPATVCEFTVWDYCCREDSISGLSKC